MTANQAGAFERDGAPISRQLFYEIACDPRRSVVVEACAGAGKTWMLVSRMLRALLDGCAPQDILAITFTKKAAGEMRQRLHQWLREFATASDTKLVEELRARGVLTAPTSEHIQALRQLHAKLLRTGRPVQIRTFHSWFAALVRSAPLAVLHELGLPTSYELLEDDKKAVALVWRRFQARVAQDPQSRADYAQAVGRDGRHQAHKALEAALNKRTEFALADAHGVVDASVRRFDVQFPDFAGCALPADYAFSAPSQHLLQEAARALGTQRAKNCQTACAGLERGLAERNVAAMHGALFTLKGEPRKLGEGYAGQDFVAQSQDLLLRVKAAQNQHEAWQHQQRMARLTRGLVVDYARLKRERGWIDMGDLEQAALVLMSDPVLSGCVQERLDARVRHLMIDEFQDTNPLQWQALHAWLAGYAGAGGQAPSVFIVGDPKQSIYRFRRAEPQVFLAAKAFVKEGLSGELLSCDHTRRNAQAVIALVNGVMQDAQDSEEFDGFRAHSTESAAAGAVFKLPPVARAEKDSVDAQDPPQWRDSLTTPKFEEEESRKSLECRQAALWIAQQLRDTAQTGSPLAAGKIMVLARKRERLGLMQAELSALHIPAQQPEKNDLADMPEVQDLIALLDVLVSGRHDLSLARVLKSPLFGISDDALVQLALRQRALQSGAREDVKGASVPKPVVSWLETLQCASDLPQALVSIGATLAQWKQWVDALPPHDALSAIYRSGDVVARYAASVAPPMRSSVIANLNALPNAALAVDGGRYSTAYSLVRALRAGGIKAPVRADPHAVQLLTIHGAKGLEAPVVVMLDTDGEPQRAESMGVLLDWPGEAPHPTRFVFMASESRPPACAVDALVQEQKARRREELNALYVALTRTRETLLLSSMAPRSANPGSWWQRVQALATEVTVGAHIEIADTSSGAEPQSFVLKVLPDCKPRVMGDQYATMRPSVAASSEALDSLESRMGQAMHRLLEWLPVVAGGHAAKTLWTTQQLARIGREFTLDADQVAAACEMARSIAAGDGAWAWNADAIAWQANEVPVHCAGRLLRIDRLVQDHSGQWWVLDYKSSAQPQLQTDLCDQLRDYRAAIARIYPDQKVRCAFLTPQGALIEIGAA